MQKPRRYEIAIGFLLATVFWAGVLGWQSSHAPTEKEKQECNEAAKAHGRKTEECKTIWERTTSDPVALFTAGIFIFTAVLGVSTIFLWRSTKYAAVAAKIAADHIPVVERAYVFFGPDGSGPIFISRNGHPMLKLEARNYGQTPGILRGLRFGWSYKEPIADEVVLAGSKTSFYDVVIEKDKPIPIPGIIQGPPLTILSGNTICYFVGHVGYVDIFRKEHVSRVCFWINSAGEWGPAGSPAWNDWT